MHLWVSVFALSPNKVKSVLRDEAKKLIYLKLLSSFMKIGIFSFGGGYAMIPMILKRLKATGDCQILNF